MRCFNVRWAAGLGLLIAAFAPASPASAANATVSVVDKAFTPNAVTIASGESVTWNFTEGTHNVRVTQGPVKFDSGFKSSGSFTRALTDAGTYTYVCDAHSEMRGTVTVNGASGSPAPAAPAAAGADTTPPRLTAGRISALAVVR